MTYIPPPLPSIRLSPPHAPTSAVANAIAGRCMGNCNFTNRGRARSGAVIAKRIFRTKTSSPSAILGCGIRHVAVTNKMITRAKGFVESSSVKIGPFYNFPEHEGT
jgi:hypothetical protein